MNIRATEQLVQVLHEGVNALFRQRAHHAGEGRKGVGAGAVFRALRHLAGDDGKAQHPVRSKNSTLLFFQKLQPPHDVLFALNSIT